MMTKIEEIWQELESDKSFTSGLIYKRYSGKVQPDIYVAFKAPERQRCLAAHLSVTSKFDIRVWDKFRDIKIQLLPDDKNRDNQFLLIVLLSNQHKDVFSTLSEDLINRVADIKDESSLVKELIFRLEKWRLLFEKQGRQGLSEEAQRGLFGELFFLRKFLKINNDDEYCINSWKGTEMAVQDFQYSDWAVEVKTTHGKNHQKLQISSERQLDTTLVPNIILVHLSLEVRQGYGETLVDIIEELKKFINRSPAAYSVFRLKLLETGYYEHHAEIYRETGYSIRQENLYKITDDFPRITEGMIPTGVGDVRYSIVISANENWMMDEDQLFQQIYKSEKHD